jgi:2-haloacid dehalogenase
VEVSGLVHNRHILRTRSSISSRPVPSRVRLLAEPTTQPLPQRTYLLNETGRVRSSSNSTRTSSGPMSPIPATAIYVFDAYGTLFDVHAAANRHQAAIGPTFERLSQIWRTKHLEYSWIHAQTGRPTPFWTLTERSLDYAIASVGGVPPGLRDTLLSAYRQMAAFPEVVPTLAALKRGGAKLAILSNGDPDMLADAITSAGLGQTFDAVLSVASVGTFKPAMRVYQLVSDTFGCAPADVTFLSSNRWDIAGAHVFGFQTVWLNRGGAPDEYPDMPANRVARDLSALITA